jgi:hypothetical protein
MLLLLVQAVPEFSLHRAQLSKIPASVRCQLTMCAYPSTKSHQFIFIILHPEAHVTGGPVRLIEDLHYLRHFLALLLSTTSLFRQVVVPLQKPAPTPILPEKRHAHLPLRTYPQQPSESPPTGQKELRCPGYPVYPVAHGGSGDFSPFLIFFLQEKLNVAVSIDHE